ncbi:hypothetical protein M885DRAFT_510691 [Pelagophyceae sp. CCMP2097]|nr:hypothetical protein M885DRAFT_510691 [Pelagophyceae sp. CCMP2097]
MKIYTETPLSAWKAIADFKADGSPLTNADRQANDIICAALRARYPKIPIMSEENKLAPYEERKDWEYFWCVDPLDGTKEFIARNGEFTVNIGLCKNGEPIAGVVLVPAAPDGPVMYKGVVGLGPPVREVDDPLGYDSYKSIFCKAFQESDEGLTVVASKSHNTPETDAFVAKYKNPKVESKGSSLKLLMVAEGRAHVYPRLAPTSEWDTCAAHAIVLCAGGQVLQHAGGVACDAGKPMVYNKPNVLNPFFVVYGKREARPTGPKKDVDLGGGGSIRMPLLLVAVAVALSAAAYVALA